MEKRFILIFSAMLIISSANQGKLLENPPNNYAIILIGGSDNSTLDEQNSIVSTVYRCLKRRGFSDGDILLLSQSEKVNDNLTADGQSSEYYKEITDFIDKINGNNNRLFIYIIGEAVKNGSTCKFKICKTESRILWTFPRYSVNKLDFQALSELITTELQLTKFNTVVYLLDFNYAGQIVEKIAATVKALSSMPEIFSISSTDNNTSHCEESWRNRLATFSEIFAYWAIGSGYDIHDAFYVWARPPHQAFINPWLDDNLDGKFTDEEQKPITVEIADILDGPKSINSYIGD